MGIGEIFKKYGVRYGYFSGINMEDFSSLDKDKQVQLLKEFEIYVDEEVSKIKSEDKKYNGSDPMSVRYFNSKHGLSSFYREIGELKEYLDGKKTMAVLSDIKPDGTLKEKQVDVKYRDRNPLSLTEEQKEIDGKPARSVSYYDYDEDDNISNITGDYYYNSRIWPKYKAVSILDGWDKKRELEQATSESEKAMVEEKFSKFQEVLDSIEDPETKVVFCYDDDGNLENVIEGKDKDIPIDLNKRFTGKSWKY